MTKKFYILKEEEKEKIMCFDNFHNYRIHISEEMTPSRHQPEEMAPT